MTTEAPCIEFFWDPASPYTYLASTRIAALAEQAGCALQWRPFLLGAVFQATGNKPPRDVPAKGKYLFGDIQAWARYYGVPMTFPASFPVRSIAALRLALAAEEQGRGPDMARALMDAHWGQGADIGDPAVLAKLAQDLGLDPVALHARTQEQDLKDRLRSNTDEAIARGAFGAPTLFVGDTMFWGNDRLPLLQDHLAGRGAQRQQ